MDGNKLVSTGVTTKTLKVEGETNINKLTARGVTTLQNTVVNGSMNVEKGLNVSETIIGKLSVTDSTTLTGTVVIGDPKNTDSETLCATVHGKMVVTGDLTVEGNTTYVNSNEVNIGDSVIQLNADYEITPGTFPIESGGITINRGHTDIPNAKIIWKETLDDYGDGTGVGKWMTVTDNGTTETSVAVEFGDTTILGNMNVVSNMEVGGCMAVAGCMDVAGCMAVAGDMNVLNNMEVAGCMSVAGTLDVASTTIGFRSSISGFNVISAYVLRVYATPTDGTPGEATASTKFDIDNWYILLCRYNGTKYDIIDVSTYPEGFYTVTVFLRPSLNWGLYRICTDVQVC